MSPQIRRTAEAARVGDYGHWMATGDPEVFASLQWLGVTEANYLEKTDEVLGLLAATFRDVASLN